MMIKSISITNIIALWKEEGKGRGKQEEGKGGGMMRKEDKGGGRKV